MNIIEILKVIVLGIIEGFTEWLPISSTGHLILLNDLIQLDVTPEFMEMFRVVIQLGAMLAVGVMYFKKLNPFSSKKKQEQKVRTWILWIKIIIGCLPAAILGFFLDDWMDAHLYNGLVVSITLIIYGILFIIIERRNRFRKPTIERTGQITYETAFYIGICQVLALVPGTSRSGATILGAMLLGCSRVVAAEFSFFLGLPIMAGASLLKLVKFGFHFTGLEVFYLILGMVVAFIVSVYSIKLMMGWIKQHSFNAFGYYRIILGVIVLCWYIVQSLVH